MKNSHDAASEGGVQRLKQLYWWLFDTEEWFDHQEELRVRNHDTDQLTEFAEAELRWCAKEVVYLMSGSAPHLEKRVGRIRERLEDIDRMLAVVEERAADE